MDAKLAKLFPEVFAPGFGKHRDDVFPDHGPLVFREETILVQILENAPPLTIIQDGAKYSPQCVADHPPQA